MTFIKNTSKFQYPFRPTDPLGYLDIRTVCRNVPLLSGSGRTTTTALQGVWDILLSPRDPQAMPEYRYTAIGMHSGSVHRFLSVPSPEKFKMSPVCMKRSPFSNGYFWVFCSWPSKGMWPPMFSWGPRIPIMVLYCSRHSGSLTTYVFFQQSCQHTVRHHPGPG